MGRTNYDSVNQNRRKWRKFRCNKETQKTKQPKNPFAFAKGGLNFEVLAGVFAFLFLCVNVFNYMLAGLKISLNLRVSFGCLKDSLVSVSAAVMDIINPTPSNPVMLNSFSKTCK